MPEYGASADTTDGNILCTNAQLQTSFLSNFTGGTPGVLTLSGDHILIYARSYGAEPIFTVPLNQLQKVTITPAAADITFTTQGGVTYKLQPTMHWTTRQTADAVTIRSVGSLNAILTTKDWEQVLNDLLPPEMITLHKLSAKRMALTVSAIVLVAIIALGFVMWHATGGNIIQN